MTHTLMIDGVPELFARPNGLAHPLTQRERSAQLRARRIAAGQCTQCGDPASASVCDPCKAQRNARRRASRGRR